MKKVIFPILLLLIINISLSGQSNISLTKDTSTTVNDALNFLNKKFKIETGEKGFKITQTSKYGGGHSQMEYTKIDSVYIGEDSNLVIRTIEKQTDDQPKVKVELNEYLYYFKISDLSLIGYYEVKKSETTITEARLPSGDSYQIKMEHFGPDDRYYLISFATIKPKRKNLKTGESEEIQSFIYSNALSNRSKKEFNELASRLANAFNFIIKAYGGGKPVQQKEPKEKF